MRIWIYVAMALGLAQARLFAQLPNITNQPASQTVWVGSNVTFAVGVSGVGPFSYQWLFDSNAIPTNGIITTVAGDGAATFSGDGSAATNAGLNNPFGVALDAAGDLFIGDANNNRVREVSTNGVITTVAGGGSIYPGDGGAATNASLNYCNGVAVDTSGNLYLVDLFHHRIRKVDTNGIITTVTGNGSASYSGDGGAATNATLDYPNGVVVDAVGDVFIADWGNNRVRKVDTNGIITTVAGNGSASYSGDGGAATNAALNGPVGLAVDAKGDLFIGDTKNERVREVDTNGIITTVAGGGSSGLGDGGVATNASLINLNGVAVDAFGNLFIAESGRNRIREVNANGVITTVAGGGSGGGTDGIGDGSVATNSTTSAPGGVALDGFGNLLIADSGNNRIRKVAVDFDDSPTLTLTGVTTNNAGYYQVIVAGAHGSVTSQPALLTVAVPPRTATAIAILDYGFVVHMIVTDGGYGYTNTPMVRFIGGGGSGAQAVAVVSNGVVTAINVLDAGYGYTNAPLVVIEPPFVPNPILSLSRISFLSFSNLSIGLSYQLQQSFQWYWTNQSDSFTATNAIYTQAVSGEAGGGDYRLALAPVPAQAFATAQVVNKFVVLAPVTSGGSGYVAAPAVSFVGGGGSGATGVAQISAGAVTNIEIINTGGGYTNPPTVEIAPPPVVALKPAILPGMRLDAADLIPYDNYQIEFAPDIAGGWTNWDGGSFTPTGTTHSQDILIPGDAGFFRLQYVP
jgi:sugar lactone lactonase YvrE